jgi:fatty acid desaturase
MTGPEQAEIIRERIRKQARAALTAGIVSLLFFSIVFGPGALIRATLVRNQVALHNVGHEHLATAKTANMLGIIGICLGVVKLVIFANS